MIILEDIQEIDNCIFINSLGVVKKRYQYVPDTNYRRSLDDRPDEMYSSVKNIKVGFKDFDAEYDLKLEDVNLNLGSDYKTLEEFYSSLNDSYLCL